MNFQQSGLIVQRETAISDTVGRSIRGWQISKPGALNLDDARALLSK